MSCIFCGKPWNKVDSDVYHVKKEKKVFLHDANPLQETIVETDEEQKKFRWNSYFSGNSGWKSKWTECHL